MNNNYQTYIWMGIAALCFIANGVLLWKLLEANGRAENHRLDKLKMGVEIGNLNVAVARLSADKSALKAENEQLAFEIEEKSKRPVTIPARRVQISGHFNRASLN